MSTNKNKTYICAVNFEVGSKLKPRALQARPTLRCYLSPEARFSEAEAIDQL